jgi:hypothetical protein
MDESTECVDLPEGRIETSDLLLDQVDGQTLATIVPWGPNIVEIRELLTLATGCCKCLLIETGVETLLLFSNSSNSVENSLIVMFLLCAFFNVFVGDAHGVNGQSHNTRIYRLTMKKSGGAYRYIRKIHNQGHSEMCIYHYIVNVFRQ